MLVLRCFPSFCDRTSIPGTRSSGNKMSDLSSSFARMVVAHEDDDTACSVILQRAREPQVWLLPMVPCLRVVLAPLRLCRPRGLNNEVWKWPGTWSLPDNQNHGRCALIGRLQQDARIKNVEQLGTGNVAAKHTRCTYRYRRKLFRGCVIALLGIQLEFCLRCPSCETNF